jgi:signal transduction histidine kinase
MVHAGLTAAAVVVCTVAVVTVAMSTPTDTRLERALIEALIVGVPVAAGLFALRSPRTVRFGVLLTGAGAVWSLTAFAESSESVAYSIGRVSAWLIFPLLIYLLLAFPDGRLAPGIDRRLFGGVTLLIALLFIGSALFVDSYPSQTPWATCGADCPPNAFLVVDSEPAVMDALVTPVRETLGIVLLLGVTGSLVLRWWRATPLRRRVVGPVALAGLASMLILVAFLVARRAAPGAAAADTLGQLWAFTVPAVAGAFVVGLVRRQTTVGDVLTRVSMALSQGFDRRELRTTLAAALEDTSVDVLVPDALPGRWRDADDRLTTRTEVTASGRVMTRIEDEDGAVAALVHDPGLDNEELLRAVEALILATVHHERVVSTLATSLQELEVSRKRIARAADMERSRIERDLHDGAQQRLIGMRIKLSLAEELSRTDPAAGADAVHQLGDEIELTLEELRSLAHGVYPSLLSDRGLKDSLRSVLAQSPLPARLMARGVTRHPAEIETAVYYTCMEALQNSIKHGAGASGVWVGIRQNHDLRFEVRDDGIGFVPPNGDFNGGLRNMRDRIEAVGGHLTIDSAPGHGTRIRGIVPL